MEVLFRDVATLEEEEVGGWGGESSVVFLIVSSSKYLFNIWKRA